MLGNHHIKPPCLGDQPGDCQATWVPPPTGQLAMTARWPAIGLKGWQHRWCSANGVANKHVDFWKIWQATIKHMDLHSLGGEATRVALWQSTNEHSNKSNRATDIWPSKIVIRDCSSWEIWGVENQWSCGLAVRRLYRFTAISWVNSTLMSAFPAQMAYPLLYFLVIKHGF